MAWGLSLLWAAGCSRSAPPASPGHPPESAPDRLVVTLLAPGFGPEEVEAQILRALEGTLASLPAAVALEGEAREGQARLVVELAPGTEPLAAAQAVRELLISAVGSLPDAAEAPVLEVLPRAGARLSWTLRSDRFSSSELGALEERVVRPRLEATPGVLRVESCGGAQAEWRVEVDPRRLQALGARLEEVQSTLLAQALGLPGGSRPSPTELQALQVRRSAEEPIRLGDLAQISRGERPAECLARVAGRGVVLGEAWLAPGVDPRAARQALAAVAAELPPGVSLVPAAGEQTVVLQAELAGGLSLAALGERLPAALRRNLVVRLGRAEAAGLPRPLAWLGSPLTPEEARHLLAALGGQPGVDQACQTGPDTRELSLWLSGADRDALEAPARALLERLRGVPGVRAARLRGLERAPGLVLRLERERLAALGVTPVQATQALAAGLSGVEVGRVEPSGEPIRLLLGPGGRRPAEALELPVAPGIPLGQVARLEQTLAPALLLRRNQRPAVELRLVVEEARRAAAFEAATASPLPMGMTLLLP